ncbi:ketol-acid reductoisomerase [Parvicella tangerina]|uniref:Ketol-acid reductoisomerase n=1 Tax=Parvicella tangerina TaxID=2829795 RepID=A0A916N9K6_9FLAO|nr:ketol-acid reductoisomerase [Parvicella tangerina]CAG5077390.1 Ketol-acid reductoisomerase (NADP(+)) [Parvicella tangerina]
MKNYFNSLPFRAQVGQLGMCRFMSEDEFKNGVNILKEKKIVIIGCGAQGLNQGLNMRDSGLDVSYTLRNDSIENKSQSYLNAVENNFKVGTFSEMIPTADLVINLTPDKQHTSVLNAIMPLMKRHATLSYSHGFNIVEEGFNVREDITVIMMAPKSPGSEVREEFKRGFGVPTLIAVHEENDPKGHGLEWAKAYAVATGGDKAGVLHSSFIAEVKSDLMGEQTILCGVLQTASILCFDKMIEENVNPNYAAKLIQLGWETITEALKLGGITNMMDRLSNPAKIKAHELSEELKAMMTPLFRKHMDDILSGSFSSAMMKDWNNNDKDLLTWREQTAETTFEQTPPTEEYIEEQTYFDHGTLMVAFVKAGVELAFEVMVNSGIKEESAYYESLHELPLIANTIARKKLYEMNRIISDTAEYGCYLFDHASRPLLKDFVFNTSNDLIGRNMKTSNTDNKTLIEVNYAIRSHPIEQIGRKLRSAMKTINKLL